MKSALAKKPGLVAASDQKPGLVKPGLVKNTLRTMIRRFQPRIPAGRGSNLKDPYENDNLTCRIRLHVVERV